MVTIRLRVERPWTESSDDLAGRVFLHTRRAELLKQLVDAFSLVVLDWGETLADYPREEVTIEAEASSMELISQVVDQLNTWIRAHQIKDAHISVGGEPEVSIRDLGRSDSPRRAGPHEQPMSPPPGVGGDLGAGEPIEERWVDLKVRDYNIEAPRRVDYELGDGPIATGGGAPADEPRAANGGGQHAEPPMAAPADEPRAANGGGQHAEPPMAAPPPDEFDLADGRGAADEPVAANGGDGAGSDEPQEREARPPRFTVVQVFETATAAHEPTREISSDEPLQLGTWYAIDVSIDVTPAGIEAEDAPRPIEEPMEEGDAEIAVLATSPDFEIEDQVRTLTLPPSGASTNNAVFKVRCKSEPAHGAAEIRIQLLYRLNLMEDIAFVARVVPAGAIDRAAGSLRIRHAPIQQLIGVNALPPKQMHIHITRRDEQYLFFFAVEVENQEIVFNGRAPARLAEEQLSSLLSDSRNALLRVALTHKTSDDANPPGSRVTEPGDALMLAEAGRKLWMALFGTQVDSAMRHISKWLAGRNLERGRLIQVTVDEAAGTFVFPWGLLYDRKPPKRVSDGVDVDAFWGLNYVVEQHIPPISHQDRVEPDFVRSLRTEIDSSAGLTAAVMLGSFVESKAQQAYFDSLRKSGVLSIDGGQPARKAEEGFELLEDGNSDLISFFTHGHTERARSEAYTGVSVEDFLKLVAALPPEALDPSWAAVRDKIKDEQLESDESWIELASGRITRPDLDEIDHKFKRPPVVFMNMCESVQLMPSLTGGLVDKFMDLDALAVVGTETSVPPRFAHHFGVDVMTGFLGGSPLGTALLDARRRYADAGDMFGLAYTLYGSGRVRVQPPVDATPLNQAVEAATAAIPKSAVGGGT